MALTSSNRACSWAFRCSISSFMPPLYSPEITSPTAGTVDTSRGAGMSPPSLVMISSRPSSIEWQKRAVAAVGPLQPDSRNGGGGRGRGPRSDREELRLEEASERGGEPT